MGRDPNPADVPSAPPEPAFPAGEYTARCFALRAQMAERGLDVLLVHNPADVCWACGYQSPYADWYACLVVPAEGPLTLQVCDADLARLNTTVDDVVYVQWHEAERAGRDLAALFALRGVAPRRVGVQMHRRGLTPADLEALRAGLTSSEFIDASDLVLGLRAVKSPAEIECARYAARLSVIGLDAGVAAVRPGATENTVAAAALAAMIEAGSEFCSTAPLVKAGERASAVHATWKRAPILPGAPVIIELTGVYRRYGAPVYGTAVVGPAPARMRTMEDLCQRALDRLHEAIRPGHTLGEGAEAVDAVLAGADSDLLYLRRHGYGVGIGMPPDWVEHSLVIAAGDQREFEPGMIFHTPRSVRIAGRLQVGFSETVLVTEHGCEILTAHDRRLVIV